MIYSWISDKFLAGPPGHCGSERVTGPYFPTEILADLHAKANVLRKSSRISHVIKVTSSYTITKHENERALFQNIYVRVVGGGKPRIKNIRLVEENHAIAAYADDVKFGYLIRQDAQFFRALKDYPIKDIYIKHRTHTYCDLGLELQGVITLRE